jgi:hypothetical protein
MRIGTKSLLFGAHQVLLHPWFVAAAWRRLYGFPCDPRLWIAFFTHDLGYWQSRDMDGPEGERHVELAARWMGRLFGSEWQDFCLYHSRFYAKRDGQPFSRLCVADKLAIALTPAWLYLPLARATGEIREYMKLAKARTAAGEPKYASMKLTTSSEARWYADVQVYLEKWVEAHKDGRSDEWTPTMREAQSPSGVWK